MSELRCIVRSFFRPFTCTGRLLCFFAFLLFALTSHVTRLGVFENVESMESKLSGWLCLFMFVIFIIIIINYYWGFCWIGITLYVVRFIDR